MTVLDYARAWAFPWEGQSEGRTGLLTGVAANEPSACQSPNQLRALGPHPLWLGKLTTRIPPKGSCGFTRQKPQPPAESLILGETPCHPYAF